MVHDPGALLSPLALARACGPLSALAIAGAALALGACGSEAAGSGAEDRGALVEGGNPGGSFGSGSAAPDGATNAGAGGRGAEGRGLEAAAPDADGTSVHDATAGIADAGGESSDGSACVDTQEPNDWEHPKTLRHPGGGGGCFNWFALGLHWEGVPLPVLTPGDEDWFFFPDLPSLQCATSLGRGSVRVEGDDVPSTARVCAYPVCVGVAATPTCVRGAPEEHHGLTGCCADVGPQTLGGYPPVEFKLVCSDPRHRLWVSVSQPGESCFAYKVMP